MLWPDPIAASESVPFYKTQVEKNTLSRSFAISLSNAIWWWRTSWKVWYLLLLPQIVLYVWHHLYHMLTIAWTWQLHRTQTDEWLRWRFWKHWKYEFTKASFPKQFKKAEGKRRNICTKSNWVKPVSRMADNMNIQNNAESTASIISIICQGGWNTEKLRFHCVFLCFTVSGQDLPVLCLCANPSVWLPLTDVH